MIRLRCYLLTVLMLAAFGLSVTGCSDGDSGEGFRKGLEQVKDFESYTWQEVAAGRRWEPRAGLRVLDLDGNFYLMGGRTPRPPRQPPVPGDSNIWSDVWVSEDRGVSWLQLLESGGGHWPPRAYFQALQLDGFMYVLGGQDFALVELPFCAGQPPEICPPFVSQSRFFNDVWRSPDGIDWEMMTAEAGWAGRAGLSAAVLNGEMYIAGGSTNDDSAIIGGPPTRIYYNDVWKSADGRQWTRLTEAAPWAPRAGGVMVTKGDFLYMLGGEFGFLCEPQPDCTLPYFNDVWRSADGVSWEQVTASAGWSPRPGHQCGVIQDTLVCFGGFGIPENPVDVWISENGADWTLLSDPPWNARSQGDIKYDFDIVVTNADSVSPKPVIYTFGGDRETFDFTDALNYLRVDDDVWSFTNPID
jgi:hypothetical protein